MRVVKKILKKKGKRAPGTRSLPPATTLPKRPPLGGKRRECSLVAFPWSPMVALLFAMRPKPHRRCPQKPHCIHASCGAASAFDASTGKPHRDLRDPEAVSVVSVGVVSCRVKRFDTTGGLRPGGVKPVEATVMMVDARRGQVMTGEENRDRSGDDQTMMKTVEEVG